MTTYEITLRPTRNILNTRIPNEVVDKIFEYLPTINDLLIKYHKKHKEIADDDDENDRDHIGKFKKNKLPASVRIEHTLYMMYFGGVRDRIEEVREDNMQLANNIIDKYYNKINYKKKEANVMKDIEEDLKLRRRYRPNYNPYIIRRNKLFICDYETEEEVPFSSKASTNLALNNYYYKDICFREYQQHINERFQYNRMIMYPSHARWDTKYIINGKWDLLCEIKKYYRRKMDYLNRYSVGRLYYIWRNMYEYETYEDIPEYKSKKHSNPNIKK